jgi:hypothetical protein
VRHAHDFFCGTGQFSEDGGQSAVLARSLSFLQEFQIQHQRTLDFCTVMQQHYLMEPMQADVAVASGKKLQLNGFFVMSRQKMAALSDEVIGSLYRQGYLELAFAHLLSLENFERLVTLEGGKGVV